jgi:signal transduction histidine kinase
VLEQKLAELKFRLSASIRIEITNSIAPPRELNAIQMLNCYRIVQEALQNVLKYAEATEVTIALSSRGAQTLLHITDNGKGFNVDEATQGNGLRNMRKRARTMGGEVQVTSVIEQGTTILVQL